LLPVWCMKYIQGLLFVQIVLIQSICGWYCDSDGNFKASIHNPFSNLPIHFNVNAQPELPKKVSYKPLVNIDNYQSDYNPFIGLQEQFQDQSQLNVNYSLLKPFLTEHWLMVNWQSTGFYCKNQMI
jgi:hypothetical protein